MLDKDGIKIHIDECGGIQPTHEAFYLEAIKFNLNSAINSVELLYELLHKPGLLENEDRQHRSELILDLIQNFLVHSAGVSRYFWAVKKGENNLHKKRSQNLRKVFKVNDDSPLKNMVLRHHLEHLDENLDEYFWSRMLVGHIYPSYVGKEMERSQIPHHFFRAFFTDSGVFESLDLRLELQPLIDEVYLMKKRVDQFGNQWAAIV